MFSIGVGLVECLGCGKACLSTSFSLIIELYCQLAYSGVLKFITTSKPQRSAHEEPR